MNKPLASVVLVVLLVVGLIADCWVQFRPLPSTYQVAVAVAFWLVSGLAWVRQPGADSKKPMGCVVHTINIFAMVLFMAKHVFPLIDRMVERQ